MAEEGHERIVAELAAHMKRDELDTLVFDVAKYQQYSDDAATVVFAYISGQLGVVLWNLEPGQENDYHLHPTTEHLHVVVAGECEYTLGDRPPVVVRPGQAVMVPENVAHGIRNVGTERASYMAITSPGPYEKVLVDRPA
jgi:quercetin dioxygenase-like cupin family protein